MTLSAYGHLHAVRWLWHLQYLMKIRKLIISQYAISSLKSTIYWKMYLCIWSFIFSMKIVILEQKVSKQICWNYSIYNKGVVRFVIICISLRTHA